MRRDKVSISQSKAMAIKFLGPATLSQVVQSFRQTRSESDVIQSLKETIKSLLLEIEGQLYAAKHIEALTVYDSINTTKILDALLDIKNILSPEAACDFLTYYRYKAQFAIISKHQAIDVPVDPITSKKKLVIYEGFLEYFQNHGLLQTNLQESFVPNQAIYFQNGIIGESFGIYTPLQTHTIFQLYESMGGQLQRIQSRLKQSGFSQKKYSKRNIKILLLNCLSTGLARIYKISNNMHKFEGCSWKKFQSTHKWLMKSLSFEQRKLVLRIGIFNDVQQREVMMMCRKIGIRYRPAGYPQWVKDSNIPCSLYIRQKTVVMQVIKKEMRKIIGSDREGQSQL